MTNAELWIVDWVETRTRSDDMKSKMAVYDRREDTKARFDVIRSRGWAVSGWNMMSGDNLG